MKVGGISLNIGKRESWKVQLVKLPLGKPRPQIDGEDCPLAVRFDIVWGPLVMPIRKWYNYKSWLSTTDFNRWNSGNHWFVLKVPYFAFCFLSVMLGTYSFGVPGFWIGSRTANLSNRIDWQLRLDWDKPESDNSAWAWNEDGSPKEAWNVGEYKNNDTVEITMSIRKDYTH